LIDYSDLVSELLREIPEIRGEYEQEVDAWGGDRPGPHIVYGEVLLPILFRALKDPSENQEFIRRVFTLLEKLASSSNKHVQEVVMLSVFEDLVHDSKLLHIAKVYMGKRSKSLVYDVADFLGQSVDLGDRLCD